jgi:hypothetical protein
MNMALEIGFYPKDLFILLTKMRLNSFGSRWHTQQHARKYHCYYWIFEKIKPRVNYNYLNELNVDYIGDPFHPLTPDEENMLNNIFSEENF